MKLGMYKPEFLNPKFTKEKLISYFVQEILGSFQHTVANFNIQSLKNAKKV